MDSKCEFKAKNKRGKMTGGNRTEKEIMGNINDNYKDFEIINNSIRVSKENQDLEKESQEQLNQKYIEELMQLPRTETRIK